MKTKTNRHPREGGGLALRRKAAFINALRAVRIPAFAGMTLVMILLTAAPALADRPVVVELFTSEFCAYCPPADKIAAKLSQDPRVLSLAFHVTYWDRDGRKDPYSLASSTRRQFVYHDMLGLKAIFTPQVVVDAALSVEGAKESEIREAIRAASRHAPSPAAVTIAPDRRSLAATISGDPGDASAEIWAIAFTAGPLHNVTGMRRLGRWHAGETRYGIPLPDPGSGVAVIVQAEKQGPILGAAAYTGP